MLHGYLSMQTALNNPLAGHRHIGRVTIQAMNQESVAPVQCRSEISRAMTKMHDQPALDAGLFENVIRGIGCGCVREARRRGENKYPHSHRRFSSR